MIQEKVFRPKSGWFYLFLFLALPVLGIANLAYQARQSNGPPEWAIFTLLAVLAVSLIGMFGLIAVQPNSSRVLLLFGEYIGTAKQSGFFWVNPFYSKKKVSLRIRNFETGSMMMPETKNAEGKVLQPKGHTAGKPSKVNDRDGNPIDISAVVVWKVVDTAEAMFEILCACKARRHYATWPRDIRMTAKTMKSRCAATQKKSALSSRMTSKSGCTKPAST